MSLFERSLLSALSTPAEYGGLSYGALLACMGGFPVGGHNPAPSQSEELTPWQLERQRKLQGD